MMANAIGTTYLRVQAGADALDHESQRHVIITKTN